MPTHGEFHEHEEKVDGEVEEDLARGMRLEDEEEELAGNTGKKGYLEERRPASAC